MKQTPLLTSLAALGLALSVLGCPLKLAEPDPLGPPQIHPADKPVDPALLAKQKQMREKEKFGRMKRAFVQDDERACTKDEECTLVAQHCCSCAGNGRQVGARKDRRQGIMGRRVQMCKGAVCPQVMSRDATCQATTAVCQKGQCVPNPEEVKAAPAPKGIGVEEIPPE
jgi:hypothetical protein